MRRSALILLAAILLPSLVLAWLAMRSARDQQVILEHQQVIIAQDATDALAKNVQSQLDQARATFISQTQSLLQASSSARDLAGDFNQQLRRKWDLAEVGFAVDLNGTIYSPQPQQSLAARTFRNESDRFLSNLENVTVFASNSAQLQQTQSANNAITSQALISPQQQVAQNQLAQSPPAQMAQMQQIERKVAPQKLLAPKEAYSSAIAAESDFRKLIGKESSGSVARFLEDKLRLIVWYRPVATGPLVFGAQINQIRLAHSLEPVLQSPEFFKSGNGAISDTNCALAILDDRGKPVAVSKAGFQRDWKHPFVATEIGEALPHWEAALYLIDPQQINRSALTLQLTLGLIVLVLVTAIVAGGSLMASDVRRQIRLAQQKSDFVSNVSHELKTPLTSIRMFADMLSEGRVSETKRQHQYLRIISAESARLTRLINNVLHFARMERGAPGGERRPCNLVEIVHEVVETCRPHLETVGIKVDLAVEVPDLLVLADRDALAQIILNLLSNAEKYGGGEILVRVRRAEDSSCVEVLDRGPGIPAQKREAVFKPFHRLDDSLASGISGSGLGLTLARNIARAHRGDVTYAARDGGGSCFRLRVPLIEAETQLGRAETQRS